MTHEYGATQNLDRRPSKLYLAYKWLTWRVYLHVYCRHIYRHLMRLIHRFGWCSMKRMHSIDGPVHYWCQWCGMRGRK